VTWCSKGAYLPLFTVIIRAASRWTLNVRFELCVVSH